MPSANKRILSSRRPSRRRIEGPTYPKDWTHIATAIKDRAGWKCQHCAHPHDPDPTHGFILTVHHIDGDPFNNHPSNTRALCQRCHIAAARLQARYGRDHQQQPKLFDNQHKPGGTP